MHGSKRQHPAMIDHVSSILNPADTIAEQQRRKGIKPKNFDQINRQRIQDQQKRSRAKKLEDVQSLDDNFTLREFSNIPSRVQKATEAKLSESQKNHTDYVRKGQGFSRSMKLTEQAKAKADEVRKEKNSTVKPNLPVTENEIPEYSHPNFIQRNKLAIKSSNSRGAISSETTTHKPGEIPEYLKERKAELEAEREAAMAPPPNELPEGIIQLPEEERIETLNSLREQLHELEEQLRKLPLVVETHSGIQRKSNLEEQISSTLAAIKVFGQPIVYVNLNE
eukprot:TRINITY_DN1693_c0_g1_i1.p1 TRINITY_DN1693_c0_g1~~TRINITY_DN1693_c0_g1_i1.p1  ORF type:complete len:291 (+),score=88.34 TRINITY_DN1693_c0_g1_i1:34-873(+)